MRTVEKAKSVIRLPHQEPQGGEARVVAVFTPFRGLEVAYVHPIRLVHLALHRGVELRLNARHTFENPKLLHYRVKPQT